MVSLLFCFVYSIFKTYPLSFRVKGEAIMTVEDVVNLCFFCISPEPTYTLTISSS